MKENITNNVRIAIIGIGSMGRKYATLIHSSKIRGLQLCAVCCRSDSNKRWVRENLDDSVTIYESTDLLFEHSNKFDAVLIVTPHKEHPALVIKAFEHGLHVFCDKPAGISASDAKRMNVAAKISNKAYAMMFHKRTMPLYQAIKQKLEAKELGTLLRVSFVNTESLRTKAYHESSPWRSTWAREGGGLLINQAQHPLDLWQWWFGLPKSLYADICFGKLNSFHVDDESTLLMQYDSGMRGSFIVSTIEGVGYERIEISGTKGKIIAQGNTLTQYEYLEPLDTFISNGKNGASFSFTSKEETYEKNPSPYVTMLQNFADHILRGIPLIAPGEEGLLPIELTNAAYLSAWCDEKITLPLDDDRYLNELQKAVEKEFELNKMSNLNNII